MARRRARRRSSFRKPASPVPADLRAALATRPSPGTACARPSGAARSATAGARQASLSVRTAHCRSAARSLPGSVRVTNAAPPPDDEEQGRNCHQAAPPLSRRGRGRGRAPSRRGGRPARRPRCGSIRALGERARSFIVAGRSSGSGASIRAISSRRPGGTADRSGTSRRASIAAIGLLPMSSGAPVAGRREHQSQAVDVGAAVDPAVIEGRNCSGEAYW